MMTERKSKRSFSPGNERKFNQMPSTSAHASTRITIEQKVSGAKKGPLSIKCSVDPKDVVIKRRFGEGSKPLFARDDIPINQNRKSSTTPPKRGRRKSSSSDSSEEHDKITINMCQQKSLSPKGRKTRDEIPYFVDARREADRLLRDKNEKRRSYHGSRINQNRKSSTTPTRKGRRKNSSSDPSEEHNKTTINTRQEKSHTPKGRKTPDKIPYFINAQREADRLLRAKNEKRKSYHRSRINQNSKSSTTPTRKGRRKSLSSDLSEEHNKTTINTRQEKSHTSKGRKTPDKIPYFIDVNREAERLRAKYGHSHGSHKTRSRSPPRRRSRTRNRSPRRISPKYRNRNRSRSRRRHRSYDRSRRSHSRNRYRDRSSSRGRSRRRSPYPEQRYVPVAIPMEYPYTSGWMSPSMPGYHRNPCMLRPQIPYSPLRPPFAPMGFPIHPPRFPVRLPRPGTS